MSTKTTKAEKARRVNIVYELMADGASRGELIKYANDPEQGWDVSDRTIDNYIAAATQLMVEEFKDNREAEITKARRRLTKLYRKAHSVSDYKTCLSVQQELNKLQGLYPPQDIELNRDGEGRISGFTIEVISHRPKDEDGEILEPEEIIASLGPPPDDIKR